MHLRKTIEVLQVYPPNFEWLPQGSIITGGTDQTIRIWNVDHLLRSFDEVYSFA